MVDKVKIFVRGTQPESLETEVNEFIAGKKIKDIKFTQSHNYAILIWYDE